MKISSEKYNFRKCNFEINKTQSQNIRCQCFINIVNTILRIEIKKIKKSGP